ncbi:pyridoxamine 5'-phosphate oxidase family protein [Cocleimonas sp. KMM 6892]|uniref:pyridoxamine 5'-phosphate oxidase family protein n=1 Tax=unclassified Cocleimonas TaxID=2639732 RepID=UPI002DB72DE6|nr:MULTISPECIES: pyridoxamine 5'-phosphate oxidase family protein [unclassified Cocleimonas]MEB8433582.1 pyridoxamine 5'-phosphate oxidase family protein [Cocleimonas sp. KMM 6892]MEC4716393.1 pyridoxamine 5'-phosphate oxidase family protein [Cocleimonas sp. KMM 6895]MEC4745714.1 pyridoxamine 5'-phosphate oxidase family protein [Cocleimonas sp. KMM 6896]
MDNYAEILFVNEVRNLQDEDGVGKTYEKIYPSRTKEALDESDIAFISSRESFYISSVSSTGWPYVQHRGGPKGFLKVLGDNLLGYADYSGNRQFITMGHAAISDKVALFLMDYENKSRLKILGHIKMQHAKDADPALCKKLETKGQGNVDRVATIEVVAMDWNCPKYIPQLINLEKVKAFTHHEFKKLREENEALKKELESLKVNV